jgi:hypothetical protein
VKRLLLLAAIFAATLGAARGAAVAAVPAPPADCVAASLAPTFSTSPGGESGYVRSLPPGGFSELVREVRHPGGSSGQSAIGAAASSDCGQR